MDKAAPPRRFAIKGMCCSEEQRQVSAVVGPLVGGEAGLGFDLLNATLHVHAPPEAVSDAEIIRAVSRTGLKAAALDHSDHESQDHAPLSRGPLIATWLSGLLLLLGYALQWQQSGNLLEVLAETGELGLAAKLAFAAATLAGAWYILPRAFAALRQLRPDMNLLMAIALVGAAALGEWSEAAMVSFLFAVSLWLEAWSVSRARRAVAQLMKLAPESATLLLPDGSATEVPAAGVPVGARLLVRPGQRVALDGRVEAGESELNEAAITGESLPVLKQPGDLVLAGSINGSGALEVRVLKVASQSTIARIVHMVTAAQQGRSVAERWVDRFARWYTPAVIVLAVLLGAVPLALGQDGGTWLYRSLVLLVAACPCALVISTPVTIVAGLASAARSGVLVKGGAFLEVPARLNIVALDKTGTLTTGKLSVESVQALGTLTEVEVLRRASALEAHSEHPVARAIVAHAAGLGVAAPSAGNLVALVGRGAEAVVEGTLHWIGSERLLKDRGLDSGELIAMVDAAASAGRTAVVLGTGTEALGIIALSDSLREDAAAAVTALRQSGVSRIVMLTGDNQPTAERIGRQAGMTEVHAGLLPEDKLRLIEDLKKQGVVAMVGDGVNDAPALATADLSVSLGAAGSDIALETADVALMSDSLLKLAWLINHSRRTMGVLKQNIVFALAVKLIFVALAVAGLSTLWMAIAADMGASLLVTFNGLRLFGAKHRE